MQRFTSYIGDLMKKKKNLYASQGGPIILSQIESEYGNVESGYGAAENPYVKWAANMALSLDTGVSWVMCQQKDAFDPIINTCNGFYCDPFMPNSNQKPNCGLRIGVDGLLHWAFPFLTDHEWILCLQLHTSSKEEESCKNSYMITVESRLCAAFLANDDPQSDKTVNYNGKSYWLLAWSVSILPGSKNVALNTAKDVLAMGMKNHKGVD